MSNTKNGGIDFENRPFDPVDLIPDERLEKYKIPDKIYNSRGIDYALEYPEGGRVCELKKDWFSKADFQSGGGRRGKISDFSRRSEKTMRRRIFSVNNDEAEKLDYKVFFVTLTYPEVWPEDQEKIKRDLDTFVKRWNRKYPNSFLFWKLEPQERGAPHYHLVIFTQDPDGEVTDEMREFVVQGWSEVVFENSEDYSWTDGFHTRQPDERDKFKHRRVHERGETVEHVSEPTRERVEGYVLKYSAQRGSAWTCAECEASGGDTGALENGADFHTCPRCGSVHIRKTKAEWGERWGIRGRDRYEALVNWQMKRISKNEYDRLSEGFAEFLEDKLDSGNANWVRSDRVKEKTVYISDKNMREILGRAGVKRPGADAPDDPAGQKMFTGRGWFAWSSKPE